jgi:hypothetical protein
MYQNNSITATSLATEENRHQPIHIKDQSRHIDNILPLTSASLQRSK